MHVGGEEAVVDVDTRHVSLVLEAVADDVFTDACPPQIHLVDGLVVPGILNRLLGWPWAQRIVLLDKEVIDTDRPPVALLVRRGEHALANYAYIEPFSS